MITDEVLPSVSVVVPTLNNARTIRECLDRVFMQDYPDDKLEVIVVDGGSTDETLEIAQKYPVTVLYNRNRSEQGRLGGRDIGYRNTRGELIAWIDADNLIVGDKWLRQMVEPLVKNRDIFAAEPRPCAQKNPVGMIRYLSFTTRGQDSFMCTLLYNWDTLPLVEKKEYLVYQLSPKSAVGAGCCNGLVIRKALIEKVGGFDYDIDVVFRIVSSGHAQIARVNAYYVHETVGSFRDFMKKRYRIISEYFCYKSKRTFPWKSIIGEADFLRYVLSSFLLIGATRTAIKKYKIERDWAWFYHPLALLITVIIYGSYIILNPRNWKDAASMLSRPR